MKLQDTISAFHDYCKYRYTSKLVGPIQAIINHRSAQDHQLQKKKLCASSRNSTCDLSISQISSA